jgi:hypothetical protein
MHVEAVAVYRHCLINGDSAIYSTRGINKAVVCP